jgi:hypothetical protein
MQTKKYSSYAQIDSELEILKLEKEISHQKVILSIKQTKENLSPHHIINNFVGSFKEGFKGSYASILNLLIPIAIKWIINKKRGR